MAACLPLRGHRGCSPDGAFLGLALAVAQIRVTRPGSCTAHPGSCTGGAAAIRCRAPTLCAWCRLDRPRPSSSPPPLDRCLRRHSCRPVFSKVFPAGPRALHLQTPDCSRSVRAGTELVTSSCLARLPRIDLDGEKGPCCLHGRPTPSVGGSSSCVPGPELLSAMARQALHTEL